MSIQDKPLGFFDSGVGGLSVLKQCIKLMPEENYIYFGDSKNAPYGSKSSDEILRLTTKGVEFLLNKGCKSLVIACNTATSVAIKHIRKKYENIPIIGVEPALKPAVEMGKKGKVLIMATPVTLREQKFFKLMNDYKEKAEICPLPLPKLVEFIEHGDLNSEELKNYLKDNLKDYIREGIGVIVLGCTHFPFVKDILNEIVGADVSIIDGSIGTCKHLKNRLIENNLKRSANEQGSVKIYNSSMDETLVNLSYELLKK